jgi:hypothetical protein
MNGPIHNQPNFYLHAIRHFSAHPNFLKSKFSEESLWHIIGIDFVLGFV